MIRLTLYMLLSLAIVAGLAFLMGVSGSVTIDAAGWRLQPGLGTAAVIIVLFAILFSLVWTILSRLINAPRSLTRRTERRNERIGVAALSDGFIALQAGDAARARRLAREARVRLPANEAALLLEARADLALGEWGAAREEYRALIDNPKTALAALSGLHDQARAQGRHDAALTFAHKAHALAPAAGWARGAVFEDHLAHHDWAAALEMVDAEAARSNQDRDDKKHRQVLLNTALAGSLETAEPANALDYALAALKLEAEFVPAALIAARIYSNRGEARRATSLLKRVWRATHHPHVAELYAHVQPGISPKDRLKRLSDLIPSPAPDAESANVLARAAVEAGEWVTARNTLAGFAPGDAATRDTCLIMAEIEEGQNADYGHARQWLGRAARAPRDPAWTADGIILEEWEPLSPVTNRFDAVEWKVPLSDNLPAHAKLDGTNPAPAEGSRPDTDDGPAPAPQSSLAPAAPRQ